MWRDRWLILGVIGAVLTCLACLTPALVLLLAALGLAAAPRTASTALANSAGRLSPGESTTRPCCREWRQAGIDDQARSAFRYRPMLCR